jgi:hypothetical protein
VHQYSSLLGLALALVHAAVLLGDGYLNYAPAQLLLPFASTPNRPRWGGLGQLACNCQLLRPPLAWPARLALGARA